MGRTVCTVVVAGTTMRGAVVRRAVSTSLQTAVITTLGFAWFFPSSDIFSEKAISTDIEWTHIGIALFIE